MFDKLIDLHGTQTFMIIYISNIVERKSSLFSMPFLGTCLPDIASKIRYNNLNSFYVMFVYI